jgi:hypothetical protein
MSSQKILKVLRFCKANTVRTASDVSFCRLRLPAADDTIRARSSHLAHDEAE